MVSRHCTSQIFHLFRFSLFLHLSYTAALDEIADHIFEIHQAQEEEKKEKKEKGKEEIFHETNIAWLREIGAGEKRGKEA